MGIMPNNQREDNYTEMGNNRYGGYAQNNSGSGNYRGSKRNNSGRNSPRKNSSGKASMEIRRAIYLVAAIPATLILLVVSYFVSVACGGLA